MCPELRRCSQKALVTPLLSANSRKSVQENGCDLFSVAHDPDVYEPRCLQERYIILHLHKKMHWLSLWHCNISNLGWNLAKEQLSFSNNSKYYFLFLRNDDSSFSRWIARDIAFNVLVFGHSGIHCSSWPAVCLRCLYRWWGCGHSRCLVSFGRHGRHKPDRLL